MKHLFCLLVMVLSCTLAIPQSRADGGVFPEPAHSDVTIDSFNKVMRGALPTALKSLAHKIPNGMVADTSINMQEISLNVVQDLFGPIQGTHSTLSPEQLDARNALVLAVLDRMSPRHTPEHTGLSLSEAEQIARETFQHPVVGLEPASKNKYDPVVDGVRKHGFCFGRADYVYFQLRARGVPKSSLIKLFHVGIITADIADFGRAWINHNATLVKAKGGGWWVIDPFYITQGLSGVFRPEKWVELNRGFIANKKGLVFVSTPERVNVQGGTHTFDSINDRTFPVVRVVKIGDGAVKVIEIKDQKYLNYYHDMFAELGKSTAVKQVICREAGWCG